MELTLDELVAASRDEERNVDPEQALLLDQNVRTATRAIPSTPRRPLRPHRGLFPARRSLGVAPAVVAAIRPILVLGSTTQPVLEDRSPPQAVERADLSCEHSTGCRTLLSLRDQTQESGVRAERHKAETRDERRQQ